MVKAGRRRYTFGAYYAFDTVKAIVRSSPMTGDDAWHVCRKICSRNRGTSGIGLETARQFVSEGATVAITGRTQDGLNAAVDQISHKVVAIKSDASSLRDQSALAAELGQRWGRLDILYVNAADVTHLPLDSWNGDAFDRLMAANLKGPFFLIKPCCRYSRGRRQSFSAVPSVRISACLRAACTPRARPACSLLRGRYRASCWTGASG